MGPEVGAVDHQPLGRPGPACEAGEDAVEDAHAAPADEAVVQGLVWPVAQRCVAPAQAVADDEDDAADHAAIVSAGDAVGEWEEGGDASHLRGREQDNIGHGSTSTTARITPRRADANELMGSEPSA